MRFRVVTLNLEQGHEALGRHTRGQAFFGHQSDMETPEASGASGVVSKSLFLRRYLVAGTRNCLDLLLHSTLRPGTPLRPSR
jgi:hypothetical protein